MAELSESSAELQQSGAASKLFDLSDRRVFVAGHRGMVGAAIVRRLVQRNSALVTAGRETLDLFRQDDTERFLGSIKPDVVIVAAAKVGGIHANNVLPAEFIYENLVIATNLIHGAFRAGVRKLLFLGSSCIYPKLARQPIVEEELLSGALEPTNEWYAIAKIAGVKLCQAYRRQYGADYISVMPCNVYGPGDNYHPENSHVIAALIRRFHEAKQSGSPSVTVWGTGTPRREFIFVDDLAEACLVVLEQYSGESHLNIGTGEDITIAGLARVVAEVIGYRGELVFDPSRPDGPPQKLLDVSRLSALGWKAHTPLRVGLERSYADFLARAAEHGSRKVGRI
ncbi:MAG: GDP-L-fucose synthase [Xanthobacteraceae bacterium]|jgi:GDP-L-fucose synthase